MTQEEKLVPQTQGMVSNAQETANPGEMRPGLLVVQPPEKTRYKNGQEIDYEGLVVEKDGQDVTERIELSTPAGTAWKRDWKKLEIFATLPDAPDYEPASFILKAKRKIWPFILLFLALLIGIIIAISLHLGVPPQDLPVIFADAIGITNNNADAHANIEGTTSFQSPRTSDTRWVANSTAQHFVMANPSGNTVALAPHIYIDFDGNGEFSEDECVYNKITYAVDGSVSSYGEFIDVGRQLEDIQIDRPIAAGEYRAKVLYTAVDKETKTLCNGNEFVFDLTVS